VFVVDASSDVQLSESTLAASSLTAARPQLRLENVASESAAERERVYRALCAV
jgi:hypothetical protein